jgi:Xaa-Pro aminopeptidase
VKRTNIAHLREMYAKATPGPLRVHNDECSGNSYWVVEGADGQEAFDDGSTCGRYDVACLPETRDAIVAAMNALPALLDELEALRAVRDAAERECLRYGVEGLGESLDAYTAAFGEEDET